ncbi:MAG: hydroxyacid dehydrogenase [Bacteroidetes bacterium]|nr:hydroxyacid dehydrogenase [Bacteroidota bacterium]
MIRVLHVDTNHPSLVEGLQHLGFENTLNTTASKKEIEKDIGSFHGVVIRSRFPIDGAFLSKAINLKFIARVGSGLENIDVKTAQNLGIAVLSAPEGNSPAVGEHALGMLLSLFNNIPKATTEVRNGIWEREANRGEALDGKTIGIIGYGHTGKQFAKKLSGFDVKVLCHDIIPNLGDAFATQVSLETLQQSADIISLHLPLDESTLHYVNREFIEKMHAPFWLINTARGNQVVTTDLIDALKNESIRGACLDVHEMETAAFDVSAAPSDAWKYLTTHPKIILSPHVAGWTVQSHAKLSKVILEKIKTLLDHGYFK